MTERIPAISEIGVIGDSIALGTAWALGFPRTSDRDMQTDGARAQVGASGNTIATWPVPQRPILVVSMGSNPTRDLATMLGTVHGRVRPDATVIFILPCRAADRAVVASYAAQVGARTVTFAPGADGVHPRSYPTLAAAILSQAASPAPHVDALVDQRTPLFDRLRRDVFGGLLTQPQVEGITRILDFAEERQTPSPWLAYLGATATWETGRAMQPVEEAFNVRPLAARMAYLRAKPYWPFYGRGLVQVTWAANYAKFGVTNPDDLCTWPVALRALFDGMERGLFTGRKLADFIAADGTHCDFIGARRIVNGTDRASEIAAIARAWDAALTVSGYGRSWPATAAATRPPNVAASALTPSTRGPLLARLGASFKSAFFRRKDAA